MLSRSEREKRKLDVKNDGERGRKSERKERERDKKEREKRRRERKRRKKIRKMIKSNDFVLEIQVSKCFLLFNS